MASVRHTLRNVRFPALTGVCAVAAVSLLSVVCAEVQKQPAAPLPEPLRKHLVDERFEIVTSVRGLPLGVREAMQTLFGSQTLDIAEPGAAFQIAPAVRNPELPTRRLIAAGCSIDHCLVHYERGGKAHTWHVALFHWTPQATQFEWGGIAPNTLTTVDDVRSAVLAGNVRGANGTW